MTDKSNTNQLVSVSEVLPEKLVILPIITRPIFPNIMIPITFSGEQFLEAIKRIDQNENKLLGLVFAKEANEVNLLESDLYDVGTIVKIHKVTSLSPNTVQVIAQGINRFKKVKEVEKSPQLVWEVDYNHESEEGVEVKLIIDGVGSRKLPKSFIREMRRSGIELETFFPLYFPIIHLRVNYRTHRKIVIVDGKTAYMGGFNIGEDYLGRGPLGYWRDTHVRLHGSIIRELQKEFLSSWHFTKEQRLFKRREEVPPVELKRYFPTVKTKGECPIQVVGSAPDYDFRLIRDGFLKIISSAKKYIYIHTPYFIPDDSTYEALKLASLSGVKVKIIIPNKPDHMMVY